MEVTKKEREEQPLFLTFKVITDETFSLHEGFDLVTMEESKWPPSDFLTFRVSKQETYGVFKLRVAQRISHPESQFRLWVLVNRQNKTVRPDCVIPENEPSLSTLCNLHADQL